MSATDAIGKNMVVMLAYRLSTLDGELLEEAGGDQPAAYLHGGYDSIFPKVEAALEGRIAGDEIDVILEPQDAFGDFDADLVRVEPVESFPGTVQVGSQFEGESPDGRLRVYTVTDIAEGQAVVDGNHPLAGNALRVACRVVAMRAALPEEIAHGHVHGPGDHHHS